MNKLKEAIQYYASCVEKAATMDAINLQTRKEIADADVRVAWGKVQDELKRVTSVHNAALTLVEDSIELGASVNNLRVDFNGEWSVTAKRLSPAHRLD